MDAFFTLARWIGRHVRGLYAVLGAYLLIGFALSAAAFGLFLLIAQVVAGGAVQHLDLRVLYWLRANRSAGLDALALAGTGLGSGTVAYGVLVIGAVVLWRTRHHLSVLLLLVALLGGRLLIGLLKEFYQRPRPRLFGDEVRALGMTFDYPHGASFPSGHAITSVVVFGTLAYLAARVERARRLRRATLIGAILLVLLIGFSRVYFGVHYLSDVIAGVLVGLLWASFCAFGIEVVRYFLVREPSVLREEAGLGEGMQPVRDALQADSSGGEGGS